MAAKDECPGCGKEKSVRAKLCKVCRSRAIAIGVKAIADRPNDRPPDHKPISPGQRGKFYAKCDELDGTFEDAPGTQKRSILAEASEEFGRRITSVDDLSYSEMSWALDRLVELVRAAGEAFGLRGK